VLPGPRAEARRGPAPWRALTLTGVWVLAIAHVAHWSITGRSLGRVVLSDSMRTLETGEVNPGFVLFALAALATLLAGRFFCGWACHMGALQDACAWALRRVGVRPHLFRSRALGAVPFVLAGYMFVWPTLEREVAAPLLHAPAQEFPGVWTRITTTRMWEGLPSAWVAVPFLALSGAATVYFLGARGLCRYACPYGGVFHVLEPLAPARVIVDAARCDECGRCTAACTTGVRVLEQVRTHGFIADPDCVRSLDCIVACPSGALSIGVRSPARSVAARLRTRTARRYDLSLCEEGGAVAVGIGTFAATRGAYGVVPMLLAGTVAILGAFGTWKAWRLARDPNVRLGRWQLRVRGSLTPAGRVAIVAMAAMGALVAQAGATRAMIALAQRADDRVHASFEQSLRGEASPGDREAARVALRWYERSRGIRNGGVGLAETPAVVVRVAWLRLVLGDSEGAVAEMRAFIDAGRAGDTGPVELAQLLLAMGREEDAVATLEGAWGRDRSLAGTRGMMCELWTRRGRGAEAEAVYASAIARRPRDAGALHGLGRLRLLRGDLVGAVGALRSSLDNEPTDAGARIDLGTALAASGDLDEALRTLREGVDRCPPARGTLLDAGASLLARAGQGERAVAWHAAAADRGLSLPEIPAVRSTPR
jgi:polyferredoxin/Flp pilus assembly protein TadD